jgi:hypothetical protein
MRPKEFSGIPGIHKGQGSLEEAISKVFVLVRPSLALKAPFIKESLMRS